MATRLYMNPEGVPAAITVDGYELPGVVAASIQMRPGALATIEVAFQDRDVQVLPLSARADEEHPPSDSGLTVVTLGGEHPIG